MQYPARDLCEATEQTSNTISRAVSSLECKGCLTRHKDTVDARRQVLIITPKGQELHDRTTSNLADADAKTLVVLKDQDRKTLLELLDQVARKVEDWR